MKTNLERIRWMNDTFELENNDKPTNLGVIRLVLFYKTIKEEIEELLDCIEGYSDETDREATQAYIHDIAEGTLEIEDLNDDGLEVNMIALADLLGDIQVYTESEACRWGIPLNQVFNIIMDSQESKLVDGNPIKSPDGAKFLKGPNFEPPEQRIGEALRISTHND